MRINNADLENYLSKLKFNDIKEDRRKLLDDLIRYIQQCVDANEVVALNFICTHNSRRSQLAQVWAYVASNQFGIPAECYSGGTEITAVYPMIVEVLRDAGLILSIQQPDLSNSLHHVSLTDDLKPLLLFSKTYDDPQNASTNFAAVMTCNHADAHCPHIPNATRISLPYVDPKHSDGQLNTREVYAERSKQIASEMMYVFSKVRSTE
ncbi:MAG: arsenate reductase [Bacteroidia bacterium]|jgi:arsenate reductase